MSVEMYGSVSKRLIVLKQDSCKEDTIRVLAYQLDIPLSELKEESSIVYIGPPQRTSEFYHGLGSWQGVI